MEKPMAVLLVLLVIALAAGTAELARRAAQGRQFDQTLRVAMDPVRVD
jgi:hypothetical protein